MTGPERPAPGAMARLRPVLAVVLVGALAGVVTQGAGSGGSGAAVAETEGLRTASLACPTPAVRSPFGTSTVGAISPPAAAVAPGPAGPSAGPAAGPSADPSADPSAEPSADPGESPSPSPAPAGAGAAQKAAAAKAGRGRVTVADLADGAVRARLAKAGVARVDVGNADIPAQVVEGVRALAPGLAAELVTQVSSGVARGLAATPCLQPSTTSWFLGAGTTPGRQERLVLVNADATPAILDLRFFGKKGPLDVLNSREITVPARGVKVIPLDALVPGRPLLGIGVVVARGRVAAALHDQESGAAGGKGFDWIAAVPAPSRTVVVAGLPDGPLGRHLQLLAPGDSDATAHVRVLTKDNDFAPAGLDAVELRAGRVTEFDLGPAAENDALGVVVTADQPVLAGARLTRTVAGLADLAYAVAATPLETPAVLPRARGTRVLKERLLLVAPEGDAEVEVRPLLTNGKGRPRTVRVAAGRLASVDLEAGIEKGTRYGFVVRPVAGSGPVYVARVLRSGSVDLSVTPVRGGRYTVVIPDVVSDVGAAT